MQHKLKRDNSTLTKRKTFKFSTRFQYLYNPFQNPSLQEINTCKEEFCQYLQLNKLPIELANVEYHQGYSCMYSLSSSQIPYVHYLKRNNGQLDNNFVGMAGMCGIGAKGSLCYGFIAANLLSGVHLTDKMYELTKAKLASEVGLD